MRTLKEHAKLNYHYSFGKGPLQAVANSINFYVILTICLKYALPLSDT